MSEWTIFHNPNCTKSKATLARLRARGIEPRVVEYLTGVVKESELLEVLRALEGPAAALVRVNDDKYKELKFSLATPESIASHLAKHPSLIERPIVVHGGRAIIGRPPENIDVLF